MDNWVVAPTNYEEWTKTFRTCTTPAQQQKIHVRQRDYSDNEPDWSYIIKGKADPTADYIEMCKVLDRRFKEDGIRNKIHFSLSDNSDGGTGTHKYLAACTKGLANVADVFNSHTYIFGLRNSELHNSGIGKNKTLNWPLQLGKPISSVNSEVINA